MILKAGECSSPLFQARKPNYLIVDKNTNIAEIEETFKTFCTREDIAIILINQHIAEQIRFAVDEHLASVPAVLEIPSKEAPYDPTKVCFFSENQKNFQKIKIFSELTCQCQVKDRQTRRLWMKVVYPFTFLGK